MTKLEIKQTINDIVIEFIKTLESISDGSKGEADYIRGLEYLNEQKCGEIEFGVRCIEEDVSNLSEMIDELIYYMEKYESELN